MSLAPLAAALLLAAPAADGAFEVGKLAILPSVVEGAHGEAAAGQVFEACRAGAGMRLDLDVLEYADVFLRGASSHAHRAARCGSDAGCVAEVLRDARATVGLRAIVNFAIEPPLVTVSWNEANPTGPPPPPQILDVGPEGWRQTVARAVEALISSQGHPKAGQVEVTTEPPGLEISFEAGSAARRVGPTLYRVRPGRHALRGLGPDGRTVDATVVVTADETARAVLRLPALEVAAEPGITSKWWFWTAIGVAAAGATTAAVVATNPFGGENLPACVCITTPRGPCGSCP